MSEPAQEYGWRPIDKSKDGPKRDTDEFLCPVTKRWHRTVRVDGLFLPESIYRRKIEAGDGWEIVPEGEPLDWRTEFWNAGAGEWQQWGKWDTEPITGPEWKGMYRGTFLIAKLYSSMLAFRRPAKPKAADLTEQLRQAQESYNSVAQRCIGLEYQEAQLKEEKEILIETVKQKEKRITELQRWEEKLQRENEILRSQDMKSAKALAEAIDRWRWIPFTERKPTVEDGNSSGLVLMADKNGDIMCRRPSEIGNVFTMWTHWRKAPEPPPKPEPVTWERLLTAEMDRFDCGESHWETLQDVVRNAKAAGLWKEEK